MTARILKTDGATLPTRECDEVVETLKAGGLVVLPTETVYGVAALREHPQAIERLTRLKGERHGPYAIHLSDPDPEKVPALWTPPARRLAQRYWPGPVMLILPDAGQSASAQAWTGYRVPACAATQAILHEVGAPVVMTSVNRHGKPPLNDPQLIAAHFPDEIELVVDDGNPHIGIASTVVRCGRGRLDVLREGILSAAEIRAAAGRRILFVCSGNTCRSPMATALCRRALARSLECSEEDLARLGYQITSAGTFAGEGLSASRHAREVMKERDLNIEDHQSRALSEQIVRSQDVIFALGTGHAEMIAQAFPSVIERLQLLADHGIADPFGGSIETYRRCADEIEAAILKRVMEE